MADLTGLNIYKTLPVWMQNCACSLAGIKMRRTRYNRVFHKALNFLEKSQWWSLVEQQTYQDEQLQAVIRHAYDSVPYYRRVFNELKLRPDDIKTATDLPKLPVLTKDMVRRYGHEMVSTTWPKRRYRVGHTSGTTGISLPMMHDIDTQPWSWAIWWRHRKRFGLNVNDPFVAFAGRGVVPQQSMKPPFWRRNLPMHQTYVSVHHMTTQNMPALVEYLQTRKVSFYSGYPSSLYLLATYLLDNDIRLKNAPRITVTGAENVMPYQRETIEKAMDTQVADQYGASEQCGNISECELHTYHVDMEYGVVEFLPDEKLSIDQRLIVCTGLRNYVMPLIRYSIEDIATLCDKPCSCGRQSPSVSKIDGRLESYIITPDGRQLSRLTFLFLDRHGIKECQLVQDALDHVIVKLVRCEGYNQHEEAALMTHMRSYMGDQVQIDLTYVDEIPREANGKFRQVISHIYKDKYAEKFGATGNTVPSENRWEPNETDIAEFM